MSITQCCPSNFIDMLMFYFMYNEQICLIRTIGLNFFNPHESAQASSAGLCSQFSAGYGEKQILASATVSYLERKISKECGCRDRGKCGFLICQTAAFMHLKLRIEGGLLVK